MFHFIRHFSYVSTIHFLFNQSCFHYYLLLWIFFDVVSHIQLGFLIRFNFKFLRLQIEIYYYVFTIIHLLEFESTFEAFLLVILNSNL